MRALHIGDRTPEVPIEQQASDALLKRVRKLRWIGLEGEADRMQEELWEAALAGGPSGGHIRNGEISEISMNRSRKRGPKGSESCTRRTL